MLAFVVWSLLLCNCFGDKEYPEDFASILGDDLFLELEKRLMDYSDINQQHSSNTKCTFATENNLIIKTKISLDQGAIFIDSPVFGDDEINPRLSCRERCCETEDCNLAVFKEKGEHACYLFNCGEPSKCNFSAHDGFTSIGLTGGIKHDQMVSASKNQHAQDLADLAAKSTTTSTSTTTTSTTPVPTKLKKQPVPLFGKCEDSKDCAGSGTECLAGYCVCADGYHPQDGICRESCTRFQFECKNDGQPLLNPQCVAIYDACDGVDHCQDGSDEQNCSPGTKAVEQVQQSVPQPQSQNVQSGPDSNNWFDTGDFISGNEPLLERGRQYPELMNPSAMYQQPQQQAPQQAVQPVPQQTLYQQQAQPPMQNVQQPQQQTQQVAQPVQQITQHVQRPAQQVQQTIPQQQQQAVIPRPTVEKPPTYDYESNPPPRRKPIAAQRPQRPGQQGQMQVGPQQPISVQKPQSARVSQNIQKPVAADKPMQQSSGAKGETLTIQEVQPPGRHSVSGKKGGSYGPPNINQAPAQTSNGQAIVQVQQPQANKPITGTNSVSKQTNPQQGQGIRQQQKGYYTDGGFIPASNNNMNNRPVNNQRNQNNIYRNMFNKDRFGYQYQNPLYGAQKPYGRQYDNYDYNNYVYGETPSSNYNYDYNSGGLFDTQDTRGPSSDSTSYWPYYHDSYSRWNGFKGDGRKPTQANGAPNKPNWGTNVGTGQKNPSSGTETVKDMPPKTGNSVSSDPEVIAGNTKQEEKTNTPDSQSVEENHNKVAEPGKTTAESQEGDQKNTGSKEETVPSIQSDSKETSENGQLQNSEGSSEKPKKPDISVAKVAVGGDANLPVEEEEIAETVEINKFSNKTAVIVLAMGLGITAILLMFVGCRLRNVKRRLRKGRPMNSNEADYLINGMYL